MHISATESNVQIEITGINVKAGYRINIFYAQTVYILLGLLGSIDILVLPYKALFFKSHICGYMLVILIFVQ